MATTLLSTSRAAAPRAAFQCFRPLYAQRRTFLPNPLAPSEPSVLVATRTVPYPASAVYAIISDVSSYSSFLPFCTSSTVTAQSSPDSTGRTWPERATLTVGFTSDLADSFESRVYCVPDRVVEAVSGPDAETSLPEAERSHHSPRPADDSTRQGKVMSMLRTRWELRSFPFLPSLQTAGNKTGSPSQEQTQVTLKIEYSFTNPLYGVMSRAAAPKIAEKMIEAFEKRIADVVHRPSSGSKTEVHKH